jgi:excisionase family DNA binding protein
MSITPSDSIKKQSVSPELLTTKQAAELLGLGERTLWRYSNSDRAPAPVRIGATVRYRRAELMEWIAAGCPAIKRD